MMPFASGGAHSLHVTRKADVESQHCLHCCSKLCVWRLFCGVEWQNRPRYDSVIINHSGCYPAQVTSPVCRSMHFQRPGPALV